MDARGRVRTYGAAAAVAGLALVAAAARTGRFLTIREVPPKPLPGSISHPARVRPGVPTPRPPGTSSHHAFTLPPVVAPVLAAVAAVVVLVGAAYLVRRFGRIPARAAGPGESLAPGATTTARAVRTRVDAARAALDGADPRSAVLRCWVLLEEAVAASGAVRRPSETSAELASRVLADWSVDAAAMALLRSLYERARFSADPVTEADRTQARAAIGHVAAGIGRPLVGALAGPLVGAQP